MWICLNDGFISVVAHKGDRRYPTQPNTLVVRARRKAILERLFPEAEVIVLRDSDYRYRVFVEKEAVAKVIADNILNIDYSNFKNSVRDHDLHELYAGFWNDHYEYQAQGLRKGL